MKHWLFAWSWFAAVISMGAGAGARHAVEGFGPAIAAEVPTAPLADLGRASSETPVHLVVILKCRHEDDLDAFVDGRNAAGIAETASLSDGTAVAGLVFADAGDLPQRGATLREVRFPDSNERTPTGPSSTLSVRLRNVERTFATELHAVRSGRFLGLANMRTAAIPARHRAVCR